MNDLLKLIRHRQSSRVPFDLSKRVKKRDLETILEAARWAPTAHNMQNFEILVIDHQKTIQKISKIESPISLTFVKENYQQLSFSVDELRKQKTGILGSMFPPSWRKADPKMEDLIQGEHHHALESHNQLLSTPVLLLVLYDPQRRAPASEGDFLGIMSLGCMLENMWLMAAALGIGFHVVSSLSGEKIEAEIKQMLGVPERLRIAISFRIGYPSGNLKYLRVRRDLNDYTSYNQYHKAKRGIKQGLNSTQRAAI